MHRWTNRPPGDWRDHLITKNTFLHSQTPWIDADLQSDFVKNEANRPHSDPSTSRSSSCMSKSSSWDSSLEGRELEGAPRRRPLEHVQRPDGSMHGTPPTHLPGPVLGRDARNGVEAHAEGRCTPCKHFAKFSSCRQGDACGSCHLQHEPGHPGFKRRAGKTQRVRFDKMIQRLKERMMEVGDDFNLDNVEFLTAPMKEDEVLRAKIVKKLVDVVEGEGGRVRGAEFTRVANGAGSAHCARPPGPQPSSGLSDFTRDLHCDSDGEVFSL